MKRVDARWLRQVSREVADQPLPELDWERIEEGVFLRLDEQALPLPIPISKASSWTRVPAMIAVAASAAALVLGVAWKRPHPIDSSKPNLPVLTSKDLLPAQDGYHRMQPGIEIQSQDEPLVFSHQDWVRVRLNPHGRLVVSRLDHRVDLHLIQGKIDASVAKQSVDDRFTIQVGNMRVAVHGTIFSVERIQNVMHVEVQSGSVAVGPALRRGGTEGWLVTAPSTSLFDLRDRTRVSSQWKISSPIVLDFAASDTFSDTFSEKAFDIPDEEASAFEVDEEPIQGPKPIPQSREAEPLPVAESLPDVLTPQLAAATLGKITSQIEVCYRRTIPPSQDGLTIRASTRLRIHVAPQGHVAFARFDPPLSPKAQVCASRVVQSATFPRARQESILELSIDL